MPQNLINSLARKYQSFVNEQSDWNFYLGIADYIKYIKESPEIYQIVEDKIIAEYNKEDDKVNKAREKAHEEVLKAKDKLFKIIEINNLSYESLNKEIEVYNQYESGNRVSNKTQTENLYNCLEDIVRDLYNNGYKELIKDFIIEREKPLFRQVVNIVEGGDPSEFHQGGMLHNNIEKYIFAPSMFEYYKIKQGFDDKKSVSYWGNWSELELVYLAIHAKEESLDELSKDEKKIMDLYGFSLLAGEMNEIREREEDPYKFLQQKEFEPIIFIRSRYNLYVSRIHNYLIDELEKPKKSVLSAKIFRNEEIKQPTMREIQEIVWKADQKKQDRQHQERLERQRFKYNRILNTKDDPYIHAVKRIIEWVEPQYPERKSIRIDSYEFNFDERTGEFELFKNFLKKLQDAGCLEKYECISRVGRVDVILTNIDLEKLKNYLNNLQRKTNDYLPNKQSQDNNNDHFKYNPETGDGRSLKQEFRLRENTNCKRLFDAVFAVRGHKLPQEKVKEILNLNTIPKTEIDSVKLLSAFGDREKAHRKTAKEIATTNQINKAVKEIREKTGLNTKELVNNTGNVTLTI